MINEELVLLKKQIIRSIKLIGNQEWSRSSITIQFAPFINKGFKVLPLFWDSQGERVRLFPEQDDEFLLEFYRFVCRVNQSNEYNQIEFSYEKDDYENATISISFNQEVEDTFQNNLPKSKRGKTIPWWKNPEETKGLGL